MQNYFGRRNVASCSDLHAPGRCLLIANCRLTRQFPAAATRKLVPAWTGRCLRQPVVCRQGGRVPDSGQFNSPAPIVRRQNLTPAAQTVYLQLSQITNLQVIARSTGRSLGTVVNLLVDPVQCQVALVDIDVKASSIQTCIPLYSLRQIGDVVLVQDDDAMYQQYNKYLGGRYGLCYLTGLDVRTRAGRVLGKVRDFSFSPDTGQISRIVFDSFGLTFLPVNFFDCYSLQLQDILSIGRSEIIVTDEAEFRQRRESSGIFGLIPSLLKNIAGRDGVADAYRLPGGEYGAAALPRGYNNQQWMDDVRRWEMETGMRYDDYMAAQGRPQPAQPVSRPALPPPSQTPYPTTSYDPRAAARAPQYQPVPRAAAPRYGYPGTPQQQQQMRPLQPTGQPLAQDPRSRIPAGGPQPGPSMNRYPPSGPQAETSAATAPMSAAQRSTEQPPARGSEPAGPAGYEQGPYNAAAPQQPQQRPQAQQQQQQPSSVPQQPEAPAPSRRLDEWIAPPDERPRMADVLMDGQGRAAGAGSPAGPSSQRDRVEAWSESNVPMR